MRTPVGKNAPEVMVDLKKKRQHSGRLYDLKWEGRVKRTGRPGRLAESVRIVPSDVILKGLCSKGCKRDGSFERSGEIGSIGHDPYAVEIRDSLSRWWRIRRQR